MKLQLAHDLAQTLMAQHGISNWNFRFDNARQRRGLTNYTRMTISLSGPITEVAEESAVRNTILHEIAHVLVGSGNGHNHIWKAKAISIGCTGDRCTKASNPVASPYTIKCLACNTSFPRFKKVNVDLTNRWHGACGIRSKGKLMVITNA